MTLSSAKNWTYTWTGLNVKENGKVVSYTVKEVGKVNGYTSTVDGNNQGNIIITNTHTPTTPNQPSNPDKPKPSTHGKITSWLVKHHLLPQTGDQSTVWLTVVGVVILISIGGVWLKRRLSNK